jgi:hypothetical protein
MKQHDCEHCCHEVTHTIIAAEKSWYGHTNYLCACGTWVPGDKARDEHVGASDA